MNIYKKFLHANKKYSTIRVFSIYEYLFLYCAYLGSEINDLQYCRYPAQKQPSAYKICSIERGRLKHINKS